MPNQHPEQMAREQIDQQPLAGGWLVQGVRQVNLQAGLGVAIKE